MDENNVPIRAIRGRHCVRVHYMGRLHSGLFPLNDAVHWSSLANHRQRKAVFESENKRLRDDIKVHQDEMKNMEQLFQAQQQEHKAQLEQANRLQRTQLEDVHRHLRKANQQLDQTVTDNEELQEDVLAKTQQVKQYKKQVDGLKAEVIKYKSQRPTTKEELDIQTAIFESKQTEAARQLEEVTRKLRDAMKMVEEARRERDALQAEVAQLKSRKMNERHYSAAFQKEFEKRGEFQAKYHHALDRCTELFEQVLQLRGILEYHKIKIPDPPPKQRAPPADIPRATTQQPQTLISRSSEGALHTPVYHGDPAAQHTSPPLARADPPSANVPPEVHPYPLQPYKFHKLPAPIQPIPQQGGGDVYEPHTQAWVQSQPYNPSEQPSDMIYQDMRHENEANTKDLAVKVQMKLEDENIKALFAQQNAARHQEQDRQFHQQHEMAHPQQGHFHPHMHGPQHPDAVNVQPKEEESLQGVPMDPNLVCPMCGHGYRVGEIQRYRRHVKSCHGSNQ